ncbi:MAG: processive 1,2-diacylglycerol beta-glucosyltransferase [Petroclostridium sp.]|jgi:processive 1,2-diacylglycerol beta-glucosyltransferase|uniref:MGDG synthase family glycosyltransferase n=1 Tax=Petroclostridium xylanilyticum TaxID=1792311 RepID=UPI000B982F0F|nr:glycosyltransferase [Petroclostridium xylanilyticum]MBZ4646947.1 Monogalactosyldiacylglycerol synthase [Clostridia bacterium]MDK2810371.1 processive 1,2-diacylglycerol beta-glucosyltransferase [Petroclostridium sp.]
MRVLFLSVTAGQGHHSAAKAVMDYLNERNVECTMLDTFEYINPILSESIARGYLISTQFTPAVYGKLYRLAEKKEKSDAKFSISKLTSSILSRKLVTYIRDYSPDVIVCTHIFSAQIITELKEKNLGAKTIGIITDFTIHPFWEDTDLDYYITASELLNHQAEKKGIPIEKIKATGIPIHMKFSKKIDQAEARRLLEVEDKTTIFVMSGSMGYGNVIKIIRQLDELDMDFQIISVCGNNKGLKRKIDHLKSKKKIYNYGFVNNVDVIMDAANCIVTKPGGLTVSESLAKRLPMILINPIPGQEDRNVEFLLNNGLAVKTSPTFPIDEAVFQLMLNDWRQQNLKEMIKYIGKPNASKDLGDFIIELIGGNL